MNWTVIELGGLFECVINMCPNCKAKDNKMKGSHHCFYFTDLNDVMKQHVIYQQKNYIESPIDISKGCMMFQPKYHIYTLIDFL